MLPNSAPKPPKREKRPPKPIKRSSPVARSQKAIPKINVKAKTKRAVKARKHYASKAYKDARATRRAIAGGQCEARHIVTGTRLVAVLLPGEHVPVPYQDAQHYTVVRCSVTEGLEFHETEYGSDLGILREIDGCILCEGDHGYIERTRHPTRTNGR